MVMPVRNSKGNHFGLSAPGAHTAFGWGNPLFQNTGCNVEYNTTSSIPAIIAGAAGTARCRLYRQHVIGAPGHGGLLDNIYRGPFGRLSGGLRYSFTQRYGFQGLGGTPERNQSMFLTSLRYYPF